MSANKKKRLICDTYVQLRPVWALVGRGTPPLAAQAAVSLHRGGDLGLAQLGVLGVGVGVVLVEVVCSCSRLTGRILNM